MNLTHSAKWPWPSPPQIHVYKRTPLRRGQVRLRLIPGEDPADYDALVAAYHREFRPGGTSTESPMGAK
jgi:hypothetical protein